MSNKQKLELTWIGKNNPEYDIANIEPRILEERTDLSYGDKDTENMIIHGDNLLALKALLPEYEGRVKCIYIDPPYNTGSAFDDYDDNVEHSTWLSLMKPRLELLKLLLHIDGLIFAQIDDNEQAYLKILMDEVFGRDNFVNCIAIKMSEPTGVKMAHVSKKFPKLKEYILIYKRENINLQTSNILIPAGEMGVNYKSVVCGIEDGEIERARKLMNKDIVTDQDILEFDSLVKNIKLQTFEQTESGWRQFSDEEKRDWKEKNAYRIVREVSSSSAKKIADEKRKATEDNFFGIKTSNSKLYLIKNHYNQSTPNPNIKLIFAIDYLFVNPCDLWTDIKTTRVDIEGDVDLKNGKKPERILQRVINTSTFEGDLVLDSFLGSGTTAAVAHKMKRKYIGIEMGEQIFTKVSKRLSNVINGDQTGISKDVEWKGGGGYKFYELAPSFVVIDEFGNPVIDSYYNDTKLIRAMCKLTNYTFAPSATEYWRQGKGQGQGNNSLYVTTQMLSVAMVQQIVSHLGTNETLLICPKKFEPGCQDVDARITIKKIPQSILKACQFGKKEYLLPIKEGAMEEVGEEDGDSDNN